jgi:hypothetical protein
VRLAVFGPAVRPLAQQRRQSVPGHGDVAIDAVELGRRGGHVSRLLAHLALGLEAVSVTLSH